MIQKPRGTEDVFGERSNKFRFVENKIWEVVSKYGYDEIRTPIFEHIEVFVRSVGETSDIVKKEFYNFLDKGGREIALRPEGTASVIRSVVEEKLCYSKPLPLKLCYKGPMFRYERQQKGRYRQLNQFGCEIVGTNSIYDDIETIIMCDRILKKIGLQNVTVTINNLGSFASREVWIKELQNYFEPYKSELSELSVERLSKNPLRILDDKIDGVKDFVKNAPKISKYLTEKEVSDHNLLKEELKKANINFVEDETLVRGLDYYTNLVFEFSVNGSSAIGGGGRYGKLLTEFGGPDLGCIGFAFGIERIIMVCEENNVTFEYDNSIDVVIAPLCQQANSLSIKIGEILRENNKSCSVKYDLNKIKNAFTYAENLKAKYIIIIGDNEIKSGNVVVKNQKTLQQIEVPFDKIVENIA